MEYKSLLSIFSSDKNNFEKIYNDRINNESTIKFDFPVNSYPAFVVINNEILNLISNIQALDKKLSKITSGKALPRSAISQYRIELLANEIKITNDIEHVYSTRKEIAETIEKIKKKDNTGRLTGMISKYMKLMSGKDVPLNTCQDIRDIYNEIVLDEVLKEDPSDAPDGVIFRKNQTQVVSDSEKAIHNGAYPESKIIDLTTRAITLVNNTSINPFIAVSVFHWMLAYIHPFYNGNGRLDRFISSYLLARNMDCLVSYSLSYIIKNNISTYYNSFKVANDIRNRGDLTAFVITFLGFIYSAVSKLCDDLKSKEISFLLFETLIKHLPESTNNEKDTLGALLQVSLFGITGIDAEKLASHLKESKSTARNTLKKIKSKYPSLIRESKLGKKILYDLDLNILSDIAKESIE